jgi:3'-phosphoadenosine 5'-phosphosulfate sulfotransferase (PAPS reductase)/FAD synthetase
MEYLFPMDEYRQPFSKPQFAERLYRLNIKQALPLDDKIEMTMARIKDWYQGMNGQVFVSYSGGKDSTVLLHMVRALYPEVPGVFVNTGLEYPEIVKFVKATPNIIILRPIKNFKSVVEEHGWPLISKQIAELIAFARLKNADITKEVIEKTKIPSKWWFLFDAPFKISDTCCHLLKTGPLKSFEKETKLGPYIGTMAADSYRRKWSYIKAGHCNVYGGKHQRSQPLTFWKEQDVLKYIVKNKIPIASVYGDVVEKGNKLATNGIQRSGCVFCCFGLHMGGSPNRFEQLAISHPKLHTYVMDKLGLKDILAWLRMNAPTKLFKCFKDGCKNPNRLF